MPWELPGDLAHFKATTLGKPIIMGRKTFQAIGRPLPGRHSIVVTRDENWSHERVERAVSLDRALKLAKAYETDEVMIVGGGEIYRQALPLADVLRLTYIDVAVAGDTFFPKFDEREWREVSHISYPPEGRYPAFAIVELIRSG